MFNDRFTVESLGHDQGPLTHQPRCCFGPRVSLNYQRKVGLQMNVCALLSLTRFGLNAGDSDRVLSAARHYSFVGSEPGSANQICHKTNLSKLTGKAKHRSHLAPRFRGCKTVNQICEAVDLDKCQSIRRHITILIDSRWAT